MTVDETLEFLLDRGIISEKMSGGYIYEVHSEEFRYWSKNEAVTELSNYLGYGRRSKASRRILDECTSEFCIEWPNVFRHWEGIYHSRDKLTDLSGVDMWGVEYKTYRAIRSYHSKLKKRCKSDEELKRRFTEYVNRKLNMKKDLRYKKCSTIEKPQATAKSQS